MFTRCRMASRTGSQWRSNQPRVVRTGSLRTQSARHRVDHGTICGRSCANSGHCKPLCACVDRTKFVAPVSVGGPEFFCAVCELVGGKELCAKSLRVRANDPKEILKWRRRRNQSGADRIQILDCREMPSAPI